MRTTVTLDPDTEAQIRNRMRRSGRSFKQVLNDAVRAGLAGPSAERFTTEVATMGCPTVNLDRALQLAGELEDDELVRRLRAGA